MLLNSATDDISGAENEGSEDNVAGLRRGRRRIRERGRADQAISGIVGHRSHRPIVAGEVLLIEKSTS